MYKQFAYFSREELGEFDPLGELRETLSGLRWAQVPSSLSLSDGQEK